MDDQRLPDHLADRHARVQRAVRVLEDHLHVWAQLSQRTLVQPARWRAFTAEQRALVRELPLLEPLLAQIKAPVTIVIGTADRIVPPASARKLAGQIPGARLVELKR